MIIIMLNGSNSFSHIKQSQQQQQWRHSSPPDTLTRLELVQCNSIFFISRMVSRSHRYLSAHTFLMETKQTGRSQYRRRGGPVEIDGDVHHENMQNTPAVPTQTPAQPAEARSKVEDTN